MTVGRSQRRGRSIPVCSHSEHRTEHEILDADGNRLRYTKTFDQRWEPHAYITGFRIKEDLQGRGLGTRLMLQLAQELRDDGKIKHIYGSQNDILGRPYKIRLHIPDSETRIYIATEEGIDHPAFGIVQESEQTRGIVPLYLDTLLD